MRSTSKLEKLNRYKTVILRDVQSEAYPANKRKLWRVLGVVGFLLIGIFSWNFLPGLIPRMQFLWGLNLYAIGSPSQELRTIVYFYNYFLLTVFFLSFIFLFFVIAFFAYDMIQRNDLIAALLEESHKGKIDDEQSGQDK